jgi:hypothetical protein
MIQVRSTLDYIRRGLDDLPKRAVGALVVDAVVADRWRAPGGWTVEVVRLHATPDKHDGEWLWVRRFGWWSAGVRSPGELRQWLALGDLEPESLDLAAA